MAAKPSGNAAVPSGGNPAKRLLQFAACGLAIVASTYLLTIPVYSGETTDSSGNSVETSATLVDVNGEWALVLLAIPVAITLLPLFARGRAWQPLSVVAAVLLGIVTILGALSIGSLFMPALIVEVVAACLPRYSAARHPVPAELS